MWVLRAGQVGMGGETKDELGFSCMRLAGRYVLLRWLFVRRQSSHPPLRLQQGLITAQGGTTLMRVMAAITDITLIVISDTWPPHRAGSAAWRKCRRAVLPTPMPASGRALRPWRHPAGSGHRTSSPRRADISAAIPPAAVARGAPGS